MWDMTHSYARGTAVWLACWYVGCLNSSVWHDSCTCVTWLIDTNLIYQLPCSLTPLLVCRAVRICTWDMTHSYVWHDSFMWTWCKVCTTSALRCRCVIDLNSYVGHDLFIRATWLIYKCDMTNSYVWHVWFIFVAWFIYTYDMTHSYVWHDSFKCVITHDSFICAIELFHMCNMTHL